MMTPKERAVYEGKSVKVLQSVYWISLIFMPLVLLFVALVVFAKSICDAISKISRETSAAFTFLADIRALISEKNNE